MAKRRTVKMKALDENFLGAAGYMSLEVCASFTTSKPVSKPPYGSSSLKSGRVPAAQNSFLPVALETGSRHLPWTFAMLPLRLVA